MILEKIKNFLSRNKSWIIVLTLIIVQASLIGVVERYGDSLQANPVKIKCNDPALIHPKEFAYYDLRLNEDGVKMVICVLSILTISLTLMEVTATSQLAGLTFPGSDSLEIAPIILLIRWISVAVIGFLFVILTTFTLSYSLGIVAPNFVSACKPQHPMLCDTGYISVTCTALPQKWRRAGYSFPPTYVTLQGYLMFAAVYFIEHRFSWKGSRRYVNIFSQVFFIAMALLTGFSTVHYNEANWGEVLIGFLIGAGTAWMILRVTFIWMKWGKEPGLPYYWNDVLGRIIVSQTGSIPVTPLPMWHREPGQMGQQLSCQRNNENEVPQTGGETRQPPSYQPIIFSSSEYTESPPAYDDIISFNRT